MSSTREVAEEIVSNHPCHGSTGVTKRRLRRKALIDAIDSALRQREQEVRAEGRELFKNACRLHTAWTIDRYLMSNAINRIDPAEKADRHIELCQFYVAAFHGCSPEDAMSDYEKVFDQLHEESQELTSALDAEIGFPLDQIPNYAKLNPKFFERFHTIACRVLGVGTIRRDDTPQEGEQQ